jgi:hypothetical protein
MIIALLFYGADALYHRMKMKIRFSRDFLVFVGGLFVLVGSIWLIFASQSLASVYTVPAKIYLYVLIPFMCVGLLIIRLRSSQYGYIKGRYVLLILVCFMMILSNHFYVIETIKDGKTRYEFKLLADWFEENAEKDQKMIVTFPELLGYFQPDHEKSFVWIADLDAHNYEDFVNKCKENKITYVAWDSYDGFNLGLRRYSRWGICHIARLAHGENNDDFEFVRQIKINEKQFINIFKLID